MAVGQPNVLVFHKTEALQYVSALERLGIYSDYATSEDEARAKIRTAEVLFAWRFPANCLTQAPNLRWIQCMGAGVDDWVRSGWPDDVTLTRVVDQFGPDMAEYVFAYLLYVLKDIESYRSLQQRHTWNPLPFTPAHRLRGKTLGIAGFGSIGREIARIGQAFGMEVHGMSRSAAHTEGIDQYFQTNQWEEFLATLDVFVSTLPLTPDTENLIDAAKFSCFKPSCIFVNVGRGGTVDEAALSGALGEGKLRAAVLDVFQEEPLPASHPFWSMPNMYLTPHVSGPSQMESVTQLFAENLRRYISLEPLLGQVDSLRGY